MITCPFADCFGYFVRDQFGIQLKSNKLYDFVEREKEREKNNKS